MQLLFVILMLWIVAKIFSSTVFLAFLAVCGTTALWLFIPMFRFLICAVLFIGMLYALSPTGH